MRLTGHFPLFSGFLFTKSINTYGTGPCVIVGSVVACLGFVISSFAVNLPMVIILIGLLSGMYKFVNFEPGHVWLNAKYGQQMPAINIAVEIARFHRTFHCHVR